jgi:hypothetical protein
MGVLFSAPVLLAGAVLWRLATERAGALSGLDRPLHVVLEPLRAAYAADRDLLLLGYLVWQGLLLLLLWARFGGALSRLVAVDLATGRRGAPAEAWAFARRHGRSAVGARLALLLGAALPLALAVAVAALGRLPGWGGGIGLAVAVVAGALLALAAVAVLAGWIVAGFLTGPAITCDDADAFDALARTYGYAAAGLPPLLGTRLAFLGGVALGVLGNLVRTAAVAGLLVACLRIGAGKEALARTLAVLQSLGTPPDAARLGVTKADHVVAVVLAATLFLLAARWVADAIVRIACGRVAAYLALRAAIDGVDPRLLRTPPPEPSFRTATEAGFDEVARLPGA